MNLVSENLNSFVRGNDPVKSLGLGYEGKIRDFFRYYNISDKDYEIKKGQQIVFNTDLIFRNIDITELPDNLIIDGNLILNNTKITKLPNNLTVYNNLYLNGTPITELPDDLFLKGTI